MNRYRKAAEVNLPIGNKTVFKVGYALRRLQSAKSQLGD